MGFAFGMASICFWLEAQLPQFVLNVRTQSVEALSSWFLAQWLMVRQPCRALDPPVGAGGPVGRSAWKPRRAN